MTELKSMTPRRAKLRPPRIAGDVIARPRLVAQLDRLSTLTLVIAPAGYGKTTLISLWLAQNALPYAWVSLDEEDNAPAHFLLDVVTALRTVEAGFGADLLNLLNAPSEAPFDLLARMLTNELDTVGRDFVLVLDDFHVIQDRNIHAFVVELVARPPRLMYLVIASRHDPPLPQHLRVRSTACEIRVHELSFTPTETSLFLEKILDRPVDDGEVRDVALQSEGWVASVRLMGLYFRHQPPASLRGEPWRGSARHVLDYLSTAVLDQLPEEVRTFLMCTSILDRLNGALCDAVLCDRTGPGRGAILLQQLVDDGIFTVALDEEGGWYRYHTLFRQVLQRMLSARYPTHEVAALHIRASAWYEEHDLLEEALQHALAAGETAEAVALVGRYRHRLLDRMELRRLGRWLALFPPVIAANEIELLLARAWVMWWHFNAQGASGLIQRIEALLAELPSDTPQRVEWQGELAGLRSQQAIWYGNAEDAIRAGAYAVETLPPERLYTPMISRLLLAFGLQMAGNATQAYAVLNGPVVSYYFPQDLVMMASLQVRFFLDAVATDLYAIRAKLPAMLAVAAERNLATSIAWGNYFGGCVAYLQNDLPEASERFRTVLALRYHAHAGAYVHSVVGLALTYQAQGLPGDAAAIIKAAEVDFGETKNPSLLAVVGAFAAELAATQGRMEEALHWLAREGNEPVFDLLPFFYNPRLAAVRILLAAGAARDQAATRLAPIATIAAELHNVHAQIQCAALAAAIHEVAGNRSQALTDLRHALTLAEPGGVVRVFMDLAAHLATLFAELDIDGAMTGFAVRVRNLIEAEREQGTNQDTAGVAAPGPPGVYALSLAGGAPPPVMPEAEYLLTFREVDVLRLLEQRLSNKEIGQQLGISTDTVKQHTVNLFRKLQVGNRRQAIIAGRTRGYLGGS